MLVKINSINEANHKVNVTLLDIDELGSVFPIEDLSLSISHDDHSTVDLLKASSHVIIFTEGFGNEIIPPLFLL